MPNQDEHNPDFRPNLAQVPEGFVGDDVRAAHASASGAEYRRKYVFDVARNTVRPAGADQQSMPQPVQVINEGGKQMVYLRDLAGGCVTYSAATAAVSHQYQNDNVAMWGYTSTGEDEIYKQDLMSAIHYWREDELVYKCVELLNQMANDVLTVECEDEELGFLVETWLNTTMPHSFRDQWFREFFRTGFVVALKTLTPYVPREYKAGKIPQTDENGHVVAYGAEEQKAVEAADAARHAKTVELQTKAVATREAYVAAAQKLSQFRKNHSDGLISDRLVHAQAAIVIQKQYEWLQGMVPAAYTILDPLLVDMRGPKEMEMLRLPFLQVSPQLRQAVANPSAPQVAILESLPAEIINQVYDGAQHIWLSPNICSITYGDKQAYERYPTPIARHAFSALKLKAKLIAADDRTANSVRDRILQVTIGSDLHPIQNDSSLRNLASIFANPARTMTIYWNHTLKIQWIEPPLGAFLDEKRYKLLDDRIRTPFGIGRIFTGTSESAGAIGNSVMNFKGLEENVDKGQKAFLEFARNEITMLKQALGVGTEVTVKFPTFSMSDPVALMAALTQAVSNGLIDHRTATETMGFHFPTLVKRMKDLKKIQTKSGIFMAQPSANNMGPGGSPLPGKGGTATGGKPRNAPLADNNRNKKGKSQPKNKAAAMFVSPAPQVVRFVVDADTVADDARQDLADAMGISSEWVLSRAEYEDQFGKAPKFVQQLPPLSAPEMLAVARDAVKVCAQIDQSITEAVAAKKKDVKPGSRGPYATKDVLKSIYTKMAAQGSAEFDVEDPDYEAWLEECDAIVGDGQLDADGELAPGSESLMRRVTAKIMVKRRYDKLVAGRPSSSDHPA